MEPWQEPVRGVPMPQSVLNVSGLEQLRAYARRALPPTPTYHLVGLRFTQLGHGTVTAAMPATPWLLHPNGQLSFSLLASSALMGAAATTVPPSTVVRPKTHSYSQLRSCPADGRTLIARARVVYSSPALAFVEGTVEDGEGRLISHSTGHVLLTPADTTRSAEAPSLDHPVELPSHATPDPWQRTMPTDKKRLFDAFLDRPGIEAATGTFMGDLPRAPLYELVGIQPGPFEKGWVEVSVPASPWLQGIYPSKVLPGWIETIAVEAGGAACHSTLDAGVLPAILSFTVVHLDDVEVSSRRVSASATAERMADDLLLARVEISDPDGKPVALATYTARPHEMPRARATPSRRVLATVLFTDIVGSTEHVERLGDAAWRAILEAHDQLVREALQQFGGYEVKTTGDGFLATFDSASRAVQCARSIRDGVKRLGIDIRAGAHIGECEVSGGDVSGIAVHTAARIEACAGPGEIWVSDTLKSLAAGSGLSFTSRGRHRLKGVDGEIELHSVDA